MHKPINFKPLPYICVFLLIFCPLPGRWLQWKLAKSFGQLLFIAAFSRQFAFSFQIRRSVWIFIRQYFHQIAIHITAKPFEKISIRTLDTLKRNYFWNYSMNSSKHFSPFPDSICAFFFIIKGGKFAWNLSDISCGPVDLPSSPTLNFVDRLNIHIHLIHLMKVLKFSVTFSMLRRRFWLTKIGVWIYFIKLF